MNLGRVFWVAGGYLAGTFPSTLIVARLRGARDLYEQAYWVAEQGGDRSNVPLCLEGVAAMTAADEPTAAARLLGAARAAYESGRVPTMPGFEAFAATTQEALAGRVENSYSGIARPDDLAAELGHALEQCRQVQVRD